MAGRNTIQVYEHQKLYYSDDGPFKEVHWKALSRYAEQMGEGYFTVLGRGIKFSSFVGVIQAGSLTIEVLPKTDAPDKTAENVATDKKDREKNVWHQVLLGMLRECRLLKADHTNKAFLKLQSYSLLDIYLELFLVETEQLVHEGLLKKYRKVEGNQLALKGQLLFTKNLAHNLVHQERFYVRHSVYNVENIFNQLLYKTLRVLPNISNNPFIHDKVNRLLFSMPELSDIKVDSTTFEKLVYDRKTERYRDALVISKMILLHFHPDISGGGEHVTAILFDMNKLWEEFVYRRLKKEENHFDIQVLPQQKTDFWKPSMGNWSKTIRPDVVIKYVPEIEEGQSSELQSDKPANLKTLVIDTKWKRLQNLTPSDEDLKQMFVYNLFWECDKSILLYPSTNENKGGGRYHHFQSKGEFINACSVELVSVLNQAQNELDGQFGYRVLKAVIGPQLEQLRKNESETD